MVKITDKLHCVMCNKRFHNFYEIVGLEGGNIKLFICSKPDCANYGLFALPVELMLQINRREEKNHAVAKSKREQMSAM